MAIVGESSTHTLKVTQKLPVKIAATTLQYTRQPHLNVHIPMHLRQGRLGQARAQVEAVTVLGDNVVHNVLVVERRESHVGQGRLGS